MGNKQSQIKKLELHENLWVNTGIDGYFINTITKQICSSLYCQSFQENKLPIYILKHKHSKYLPNVYGLMVQNQNDQSKSIIKCSMGKSYCILYEQINYRLADLGAISFNDSIYILNQCLQGASILYKQYGPFYMDQDMVGFNNSGHCKFWYNSDLYKTNMEHKIQSKSYNMENQMIKQLMRIIQERVQYSQQLKYYQDTKKQLFWREQNNDYQYDNFDQALKFVQKLYQLNKQIVWNQYFVHVPQPQHIKLIKQKFKTQTSKYSNKNILNKQKQSLKSYNNRYNSKVHLSRRNSVLESPKQLYKLEKARGSSIQMKSNQNRNIQSTIRAKTKIVNHSGQNKVKYFQKNQNYGSLTPIIRKNATKTIIRFNYIHGK